MDILYVTQSNTIGTFLGCSNTDKRGTRSDFDNFNHKMWKKLTGWKAHSLSIASKGILIKIDFTSIHNILWINLKLLNICKKINEINKNLYDSKEEDGVNALVLTIAWDKIYRPKCEECLAIPKTDGGRNVSTLMQFLL